MFLTGLKCVKSHKFSFSTNYFNLFNTKLYATFKKLLPIDLAVFVFDSIGEGDLLQ